VQLTGGIGRRNLTSFYRDHFIFNNSADTGMELISRTIGIDRVIDEFLYTFTHNTYVDWMYVKVLQRLISYGYYPVTQANAVPFCRIPGIPPTGKKVEVPFTAIVNIRGDRLYHEHIAWDQASVLSQLGLLPEYLPYPYPVGDSSSGKESDGKYEYRLPVAGVESATKLREKNSVASNQMFEYGVRKC
jgi:carboxymethylenebutenolidase